MLISSAIFFSPLMYSHTTSSQLYNKYLQNLHRLHDKFAQSAKTTELNLRNTNTISHLEFMSYIKLRLAEIYVLHKLKVAAKLPNGVKFMSYIN